MAAVAATTAVRLACMFVTLGGVLGSLMDSRNRARSRAEVAERNLRASEEWLRVTLRSIGDGVIATDEAGRVAFMNLSAEKLTGWTSAEAIGRPLHEVFHIVRRDDHARIEDPLALVLQKGREGLASHTLLVARDGASYCITNSGAPICDDAGRIRGVVLVFQDETEQAHAEEALRRLNAELERRVAERTRALEEANAELEAFSYTIAHDLRAPVRNMHSLADALVEDHTDELSAEAREYTQRIVGAAVRMDDLIKDLLAYARLSREAIRLAPLDLDAVLTDVLGQMRPELEERRADVSVAWPLGRVIAHRTTLGQVVTNLLGNAIKFVRAGEPPVVRISAEDRGDHVRLWVDDHGIGVEPKHRARIFRVFERLHGQEAYPGTGIGLAIVRKGIERMGGSCGVEPNPGGGSRFWIELPKREAV